MGCSQSPHHTQSTGGGFWAGRRNATADPTRVNPHQDTRDDTEPSKAASFVYSRPESCLTGHSKSSRLVSAASVRTTRGPYKRSHAHHRPAHTPTTHVTHIRPPHTGMHTRPPHTCTHIHPPHTGMHPRPPHMCTHTHTTTHIYATHTTHVHAHTYHTCRCIHMPTTHVHIHTPITHIHAHTYHTCACTYTPHQPFCPEPSQAGSKSPR